MFSKEIIVQLNCKNNRLLRIYVSVKIIQLVPTKTLGALLLYLYFILTISLILVNQEDSVTSFITKKKLYRNIERILFYCLK